MDESDYEPKRTEYFDFSPPVHYRESVYDSHKTFLGIFFVIIGVVIGIMPLFISIARPQWQYEYDIEFIYVCTIFIAIGLVMFVIGIIFVATNLSPPPHERRFHYPPGYQPAAYPVYVPYPPPPPPPPYHYPPHHEQVQRADDRTDNESGPD